MSRQNLSSQSNLSLDLTKNRTPGLLSSGTDQRQDLTSKSSILLTRTTNKTVGVLCSGSESQGMNAVIRAVVRVCKFSGAKVFLIKDGFNGLINGGSFIVEARWKCVSGLLHMGGTMIGSLPCKRFYQRAERSKAAKNLILNGITHLVLIGGEDSLTAVEVFRSEWRDIATELLQSGDISKDQFLKCSTLKTVGVVGSVDNDFVGTGMIIGADSALHRITEAFDAIANIQFSTKRVYIFEVTGKRCGYLALMSAIALEADYAFIPEKPPARDWITDLSNKLQKSEKLLNLIIISEGASDCNGQAVSADIVKETIIDRLKLDVRIVALGHILRSGTPSSLDRIIGSRIGAEAALTLLHIEQDDIESVIGFEGNQTFKLPLLECVSIIRSAEDAIDAKDWNNAVKLRGKSFERQLELFESLSQTIVELSGCSEVHKNLAVMYIGEPCCGVNAVVRSFVRQSINRGYRVWGITDGINGLLDGLVKELKWNDVNGWNQMVGVVLGTRTTMPSINMAKVAEQFQAFNFNALCIIGGFDAYLACLELTEARNQFAAFCIPLLLIPAAVSNNVPGTDFTIGCDTSLNMIIDLYDRMYHATQANARRVYVLEIMGQHCGFLATAAALALGADTCYIWEDPFSMKDIMNDVSHIKRKMLAGVTRGLVIRSENASDNFTTEFLCKLLTEEAEGLYTVRSTVLGSMALGRRASPYDRFLGAKFGFHAVSWFHSKLQTSGPYKDAESSCLIAKNKRSYTPIPIQGLKSATDFSHRMPDPQKQWWLSLRGLNYILTRFATTANDASSNY